MRPRETLSNAKPWQLHKVRQQGASGLSESTFLPVLKGNTGNKQNQKCKANTPESWSKTCFHSSMTTVQGNCCGLQPEWSIWWYLASIGQVPGGKVRWQLLSHSNIWKSNSSQTYSAEQGSFWWVKKRCKKKCLQYRDLRCVCRFDRVISFYFF